MREKKKIQFVAERDFNVNKLLEAGEKFRDFSRSENSA